MNTTAGEAHAPGSAPPSETIRSSGTAAHSFVDRHVQGNSEAGLPNHTAQRPAPPVPAPAPGPGAAATPASSPWPSVSQFHTASPRPHFSVSSQSPTPASSASSQPYPPPFPSNPAIPTQYQAAQPVRQSATPRGRVAIVEPPGTLSRLAMSGSTPQFRSPTRDHAAANPKFEEDVSRLTHATQQSLPEAVRRVVRDNWEKSLLGSDFHMAFVLNAAIHHAQGTMIRRAVADFGKKMVLESKKEVIGHFQSQDLDEVADAILDKVTDDFLDKALDKRLATIDARSLINALARAERLGYENDDIVSMGENLSRGVPSIPAAFPQSQPPLAQPPQPQPVQTPGTTQHLQCPWCWRKFLTVEPYKYHMSKQLCKKAAPTASGFPFACPHCGAGFLTSVGQDYHLTHKVCGDHGMAPPTPKPPYRASKTPQSVSAGEEQRSGPSGPTPQTTPGSSQVTYGFTPANPRPQTPSGTPTADSTSKAAAFDPYAHLDAAKRAELEAELARGLDDFQPRFKEAEEMADEEARKSKLESLHNVFRTKQSLIRKKYGVRLRQRRSKEEIEAENQRLFSQKGTKRRRIDNGTRDSPSHSDSPQPPSSVRPASSPQHLSVSSMKSAGLGGSSATAALSDPTFSPSQSSPSRTAPSRNSLSSYQRNGYRIDHHVPRGGPAPPEPAPSPRTSMTRTREQQRNLSVAEPILVDDSSGSSDSDPDEEIPATRPPKG